VIDRRQCLIGGGCAAVVAASYRAARAQSQIYLADMHRHLFFNRLANKDSQPLGASMASGGATLVAWAITTDVLWIAKGARGYQQTSTPENGQTFGYFQRELARIKAHIAAEKLKVVMIAADVEAAMGGDPHVVLATEGSVFLEDDLSRVQTAFDLGVRHIQLVHYVRNPVADFQTEEPKHGGLTSFGRDVVRECNRLGILIDLAHCTERAVDQVLEMSDAPVVWSHSSIAPGARPHWSMIGWKARQLTLAAARRIAAKGGVIGLWAMRLDAGGSFAAYAERMLAMADQVGEDHVAFGTDLTDIPTDREFGLFRSYGDLRKVVEFWEQKQIPEPKIRKLAGQNYARVLQRALPRGSRS
jgi:membrane dipeptidase